MIRTGFKHSAIVSLVAVSAASALLVGCKQPAEKADEAVAADVKAARESLPDKPDGSAAIPLLSKAVNNPTASASQKAIANMAAGQAEVLAADALFQDIDVAQNRLERLLGRVGAMASEIAANNVRIGGLTSKEPTKALAAIDKTTAAAKSGEQGVWFASDTAPIPALAAIEKSIADLTASNDALKAQSQQLQKQRADALQQAEKLSAQSEQSKGKEAVDLYTQASNLRKTAGGLSIQMQTNSAEQARVARELAVAQAQQTQLQTALTKFAEENKQVNAGWEGVKKRIDDLTARTRSIIEGDGSPPPAPTTSPSEVPVYSLAAAGDQIAQVSADLDKLRADAKSHLDKADKYFAEAAKLNKRVADTYSKYLSNSDLRESPERQGWQWMVELHGEADPTLRRAQLQQRLARLYADEVYYTGSRLAMDKAVASSLSPADAPVKAVLDQAKLAVPKTLESGTLEADIAAAKTAANDAFKQSETYLADVIDHAGTTDTGKAMTEAANVTKMVEQYGHWAFARATGDAQADVYLTSAKGLAATLTNADVALPAPLPAEIAPPPPNITSGAPVTSAGTQAAPTSEPTTAPATQEAPATSPASAPATPDAGSPAAAPAAPSDATPAPAAPAPATPAPSDATPAPATPAPAAPAPADATPPATPAAPSGDATPAPTPPAATESK